MTGKESPEANIDLGYGVIIEFFVVDDNGERVGLVETHPASMQPSGRCSGSVRFDTPAAHAAYTTPGPFWQVVSLDPLTLSPSLLCHACGNHGFIRDGKWQVA